MKKEISSAYPFEQKVMQCSIATAFLFEQKVTQQFAATQLPYWEKFHEMTCSHSTALLGKKSCDKLVPLNCLIEQKVTWLLQHKAKCPQRATGIETQEVHYFPSAPLSHKSTNITSNINLIGIKLIPLESYWRVDSNKNHSIPFRSNLSFLFN